jgi:pimeloyl-ACP methyl ester carboxylesterase
VLRAYGDGNLFGEPFGDGPVRVVWLHGWGRRGQDFAASATLLANSNIASVALDLPGFGASPLPAVSGGARLYAELVAPAIKDMGTGPYVLVGHSFGGTVATVLAARHPSLVRAVVLTGSPILRRGATSSAPTGYRTLRWLHRRGIVSDVRMEAARQKYGSLDYRNAHGLLREVLVASVNESYEEELAMIHQPVALVWGENDREVPSDVARRGADLLAGPHTLRVLPGVGHFVPTEAPGELVASVNEVLA